MPNATNLFCSGHVLLPDGRLLVVGGNVQADVGIKDTTLFDSATNTWSKAANMSVARWYPTATVLGNGKVFVFSGDNIVDGGLPFAGPTYFKEASQNSLPSIYDPATNTWPDLTGAKLTTPLYPFLFQLSDGRILDAGPDVTTRVHEPRHVDVVDRRRRARSTAASAVMYLPGQDHEVGHRTRTPTTTARRPTTPTAEHRGARHEPAEPGLAHDGADALPARVPQPDAAPRRHGARERRRRRASDGTDLTKAVLPAEIWNPATETWTTVASLQTAREYHSTALLLPDGRVLMAGGGQLPGRATNIDNARDLLAAVPLQGRAADDHLRAVARAATASSFTVTTPDAASIQKVALDPHAVRHARVRREPALHPALVHRAAPAS